MTMNRPQPRSGVLDIAPYVPGKSTAPGVAKVFKLSSNETPLGPSANAIAAYRAAGEHLEDYPDGSAAALRDAIGAAFGLDPDRIVCGAGSDDLLNLLARAYLTDGDEGIYTKHGFVVYPIATMCQFDVTTISELKLCWRAHRFVSSAFPKVLSAERSRSMQQVKYFE